MTTQAVRGEKGIALLAVLVTLALMITLIGPFLISMTQSGEAAEYEASERESRVLVRGLRDSALQFVAQSQGSADPTPRFDSSNEIPRRWTPPSLPGEDGQRASDEKPLGERRPVGVDLLDVNARIFAPTMPQQIWANHFGWYAVLSEDLEIDEEERMAIQGGEQLPDSGFVWLGNECIRYERKGFGTLEGLTRGWSPQGQVEPNTVPDPYGPKTPHASGQMMHDMRVRLLATWAFDPGYGARAGQRERFLPFQSVEEIVRVDSETFGEIPREGLEELGELLVFDSARVHGGAFGKEERVFSAIEPGITTRLAVKDATSFPAGTVVHVSVQEQSEWALVIGMGNGSRGSSAQLPLGGATLLLDRPLRLQAPEEQARIRPLLPVPVNINTCSEQVLALMIEGVRTRRFRSQHGVVSYPLSRQKAKQIAERIYLSRSYDPDADVEGELPFENWQALHKRVLEPMRDEELLSNPELFHLYALFMNGIEHRLEQGGVPISYESSGLVEYRAAAAVLSGIGETLARREVTGLALPQPERSVERFYVSQEDFDEASRLARSRPYWSTGPIATNVRPDRSYSEPPDPSIAHLMPWVHGKSARFPSTEAQDSQAMLATNRIPDYGRLSYGNGFPEADHPEGLDLRQQEAPAIKSSVSVTNPTALAKTIMDGVRQGQVPVIPMAMQVTGAAGNAGTGRGGLGLAFGISAWWKPYSMRESILFDVNGGNPFRNRIFLTMDSGGLTLRMYDSAGQDPAPGNTSPEETALRWIVEPGTAALQENLWFHTAVEIAGGTPSGVALFTDGALLGKPAFLTRTTGGLGELQLEPRHDVPFFRLIQDSASTIGAEDSSTFPERGVLRYGNELIEYSGRSGGSFNLKIEDSIGGRMARGTFRLQRPGNNDPSTGATVQNLRVTAPSHPSNSSISLYGYSNPIVEDAFVVPGKASLLGTLGRWAPARVTVGPDDVILTESARSISLGKGLDRDTQSAELQLGPADGTSKGKVTGFDSAGGYAVLVQRHYLWQGPTVGATETRIEEEVGGVELVRYSGFNGSTIRITRGNLNLGTLPISRSQGAAQTGANDAPYLRSRHFVTEWNKGIFSNQSDPNDEETMWCYLVPVSIAISPGMTLPDPAELGHSEWLQIYNAADENLTEWVRYDKLVDGRYAMRIHPDALGALQNVLTTNNSQLTKQPGARGPYEVDTGDRGLIEPPRSGWPRIGEPNSEENALDYTCRLRFCFRGDPYTGTATHDQSNADVLPVFRTVLGSLELGRPGRGDRVALLTGANSAQASAGEPEWQQVNWERAPLARLCTQRADERLVQHQRERPGRRAVQPGCAQGRRPVPLPGRQAHRRHPAHGPHGQVPLGRTPGRAGSDRVARQVGHRFAALRRPRGQPPGLSRAQRQSRLLGSPRRDLWSGRRSGRRRRHHLAGGFPAAARIGQRRRLARPAPGRGRGRGLHELRPRQRRADDREQRARPAGHQGQRARRRHALLLDLEPTRELSAGGPAAELR
jgi:hypothetical protein